MFFDKLWVRIKGEIASLKDDRETDAEPGQRSGSLLEAIDRRLFPREDRTQIASEAAEERLSGEKFPEPKHGAVLEADKTVPDSPRTLPGPAEDAPDAAAGSAQPNPRRLG